MRCRSAVGDEDFELSYDTLVIAVGTRVADYGVSGVKRFSLSLASVEDGRALRRSTRPIGAR